jgi:uncharacterized membrane protein
MFYLQWVFLVLLYFFGLTWITTPVERFFFENNDKVIVQEKPEPIVEVLEENETKEEVNEELKDNSHLDNSIEADNK